MFHFFSSAFRSLSARSMDRCFVAKSITQQINIAKRIRDIDNKPRFLFSKHFVAVRSVKIGEFDVLVDANGAQAVFSDPANACFTCEYYFSYVKQNPEIISSLDSVLLPASSTIIPQSSLVPAVAQTPLNSCDCSRIPEQSS